MTASPDRNATRAYGFAFAALLALTALTVGAAFLNLGGLNNAVALAIAGTKAMLVVVFFMHLRDGSSLVWTTLIAGCFWLVILMGLTLTDYLTRS